MGVTIMGGSLENVLPCKGSLDPKCLRTPALEDVITDHIVIATEILYLMWLNKVIDYWLLAVGTCEDKASIQSCWDQFDLRVTNWTEHTELGTINGNTAQAETTNKIFTRTPRQHIQPAWYSTPWPLFTVPSDFPQPIHCYLFWHNAKMRWNKFHPDCHSTPSPCR